MQSVAQGARMSDQSKLIMGLDLSLTGTGIVVIDQDGRVKLHSEVGFSLTRQSSQAKRIERLLHISREILRVANDLKVTDVGIENYAFRAKGAQNDLGELHGTVKTQLYLRGIVAEYLAPTEARKLVFNTGKRVDKKQVIGLLEEMGFTYTSHNIADAHVIAEAYRRKMLKNE